MLLLKSPYLVTENLTIFCDDTDNTTFYYVPRRPCIDFGQDRKPNISVYAIRQASSIDSSTDNIIEAGFNVDIVLKASENDLKEAAAAVKKFYNVDPKVLVGPHFEDGIVHFKMAQAGEDSNSSKWFVSSGFRPSMVGSNSASVVVSTTGDNARQLIGAINSGIVQASINYDLQMVGITPVYHAKLLADMQKVYDYLDKKYTSKSILHKIDIENLVQSLVEERHISVEIEELDPIIKAEALQHLMNELQNIIVEQVFETVPLMSTAKEETSVGEKIRDFFSSLLPSSSYIQKSIDERQVRTFVVDLNQKTSKIYHVNAQANLSSLIEEAGINISEIIKWINLDEMPHFDQPVNIRVSPDIFRNSSIHTLVVRNRVVNKDTGNIKKDDVTFEFSRENGMTSGTFHYLRERDSQYRYEYQLEIYLDVSSSRSPNHIFVDWQTSDDSYLYIDPSEFYQDFKLGISLQDCKILESAPSVQVDMELYKEGEEQPLHTETLNFDGEHSEKHIVSMLLDKNMDVYYNLRVVYYLEGLKEHILEYKHLADKDFRISNPFETNWNVILECNSAWDNVKRVLLDTRLKDSEREEPIINSFTFTSQQTSFDFTPKCSSSTPKRTFDYLITVMYNDGTMGSYGWCHADDKRALSILADTLKPERFITVKLADPLGLFKKNKLTNISLVLSYIDKSGQEVSLDPAKFNSVSDILQLSYPAWGNDYERYYYRFTARGQKKGQRRKTESRESELTIELHKEDFGQ